jgi:PilZ domain-containing protein
VGHRRFLLTGRFEHRIAKTEVVELLHVGESAVAKVEAITENVSSRGARIITDSICVPGQHVCLDRPKHLKLPGRVVYCQPLEKRKFAVGLHLDERVEEWTKHP